jgi:hypothetical protein
VNNVLGVVHGLQFLFLEPNPDDPLNKGAPPVMFFGAVSPSSRLWRRFRFHNAHLHGVLMRVFACGRAEAAEMMTKNESHFRRNVAMTMRGGRYR